MSNNDAPRLRLPALDPATVAERRGSKYPAPFRDIVSRRSKQALGDAVGLDKFGVNLVRLDPGAWSSQRHWHTHEDEFVYVLEGELCLVTDEGEQVLGPGMSAGFPAGKANGHHFINRSNAVAVYLEVGNRDDADRTYYPDVDLEYRPSPDGGGAFVRRSGEPY